MRADYNRRFVASEFYNLYNTIDCKCLSDYFSICKNSAWELAWGLGLGLLNAYATTILHIFNS